MDSRARQRQTTTSVNPDPVGDGASSFQDVRRPSDVSGQNEPDLTFKQGFVGPSENGPAKSSMADDMSFGGERLLRSGNGS